MAASWKQDTIVKGFGVFSSQFVSGLPCLWMGGILWERVSRYGGCARVHGHVTGSISSEVKLIFRGALACPCFVAARTATVFRAFQRPFAWKCEKRHPRQIGGPFDVPALLPADAATRRRTGGDALLLRTTGGDALGDLHASAQCDGQTDGADDLTPAPPPPRPPRPSRGFTAAAPFCNQRPCAPLVLLSVRLHPLCCSVRRAVCPSLPTMSPEPSSAFFARPRALGGAHGG